MRSRLTVALSAALTLCGCHSAPLPYDTWRTAAIERAATSDVSAEQIEQVRASGDLARAHDLAIAATTAADAKPSAFYRAARAEADALCYLPEDAEEDRERAAWSGLAYAEQSVNLSGLSSSGAQLAQLAWSLGMTTHLLPMFDRGPHAHRCADNIRRAKIVEPAEATALATEAILGYRLATLPWIAKALGGAPPGDLDRALIAGGRAYEIEPSKQNAWILAQVLFARGEQEPAREFVERVLAQPNEFARDSYFEDDLRELLEPR